MKSSIKVMLLGIVLILSGIFLRCIAIEHIANDFFEFLWWSLAIGGVVTSLIGFFSEDSEEK